MPVSESSKGFLSLTRTSEELSIVCTQGDEPPGARCQPGWRCLKVRGPLDFSLTGVIAVLAVPLAEAKIPIFALSTYDTDYVLVKEPDLKQASRVLQAAGLAVGGD